MGKTLDSVLFNGFYLIDKTLREVDNFYDKPGKTPLREVAKHLVPSYTVHKISQLDWFPLTVLGMGIESAKIWGYIELTAELGAKILR